MQSLSVFVFALVSAQVFAASGAFDSSRSYAHHLFRTQKECLEARERGQAFNCVQEISFHTDGTAAVMVTDIMNPATYTVSGNKVIVKRSGAGDMPAQMAFTLDRTGRNLVETGAGPEVWEGRIEGECR